MNTVENFIDELMQFDPIAEAEQIIGHRYGDEVTGLGLLLHMSKSGLLNEFMSQTQDTKFSENFNRYHEIATSIGFEVIYEEQFVGNPGEELPRNETFRTYWHPDGLLLTVESYYDNVNTAKVYYNVRFNEDGQWVTSSGGCAYTDHGVWVGDHDVREGLKHKINSIRKNGVFLTNWIERPFLWLLNYREPKEEGYDHKAINAAKIAQFPEEIQKAITPVYVACDYTSDFEQGGFNTPHEAWEWIEDHGICSDCRNLLSAGGFWREPFEEDYEWQIQDGKVFERINYVADTLCGAEWFIETQTQLDEWRKESEIESEVE
jgi:hypothetical protein